MRDHILPPRDIGPNLLEARFRHFRRQRRILPTLTPPPPHIPSVNMSCNPVLKDTQGPLYPVGQNPHLLSEQQHRLKYRREEVPRYLQVRPLLDQNTRHPPTTLPSLLQVACHSRPFLISCRYHPPHIIERCHIL